MSFISIITTSIRQEESNKNFRKKYLQRNYLVKEDTSFRATESYAKSDTHENRKQCELTSE